MTTSTRRRAVVAMLAWPFIAWPVAAPKPVVPVTPASALEQAIASGDPFAFADTTLPRLAALDSAGRARLAVKLASWSVPRCVAAFAFLQVGTPYRLGPLGEGVLPDTDPVLRFDSTDCAVLNLTAVALAHANEAGGERAAMAIANYRDGHIGYDTRLHFTTDRLDASPYWRDVTEPIGGPLVRRQVVRLNRRANGGRWIAIDWSRSRRVTWLPRAAGARFAQWADAGRLPEVVGVAFVRRARLTDGLDVVHESLLWRGRTLLHASSLSGRVVTMPWSEYLAGPGRGHDGFVLFEYR